MNDWALFHATGPVVSIHDDYSDLTWRITLPVSTTTILKWEPIFKELK